MRRRASLVKTYSVLLPAIPHLKHLYSSNAHQLFDDFPHRPKNAFFYPLEAIRDPTTLAVVLKSCRCKAAGAQLHGLAVSSGLDSYAFVSNSLMNMYAKSGLFDNARVIFATMPNPDVVSWNTILSASASGVDGLEFVRKMHCSGMPLDVVSLTVALAFSADLRDLEFGQQLHSLVFRSGFNADTFAGNALITMYARSACLREAKRVFDEMVCRDLVSWNAMISGLTQEGHSGYEAIDVFLKMMADGVRPDHVSLASVISACCQEGCKETGCQVQGFAFKVGLETHVLVSNVLMTLHYKHGSVDCARIVFEQIRERNIISWTTMISIDTEDAILLFNAMRSDGTLPNDVTFIALIYAISTEHLVREGQMIHGVCLKSGMLAELIVSNSLITMYSKLSSAEDSRKVFEEVNEKEIVTWNALISGYAQNGLCEEALQVFSLLICQCVPNQYTFGSILGAITAKQTVSLTYGQRCHCFIVKLGLDTDEFVPGALIDMYAKRGSIDEAKRMFSETRQKSLISWTAIISAHAKHGSYDQVMTLFEEMVDSGVEPDHVAFLAVLTACGCKGMVDKGREIFDSIICKHKIDPWPEHYSCMVDMLGRAGRLIEAEEFANRIPQGPGVSALQSLLGACRVHGNMEMAERVAQALMEKEPEESGSYVLMSNMYAEKGEWENVAKIRKGMRERGVKKEVGFSWVDVGIRDSIHMHKFSSDDKTRPLAGEVYTMADFLGSEMKFFEDEGCHSKLL